ncbi:DUF2189 domain-containing protein [Methylobacterium sp. J-090]|uniref:DUF2189 domain-containing protein n=1 Tax=Methylobacterium sp. J-090 TaxID=2836666 RepID=UPI001FBB33CD|nr:DUF2189 domain-containing protein [Methylobacterium sp. J-090]MCJ2083263.1 DUF2189 domain-containing protein [Methylobacterium sp. J-090]
MATIQTLHQARDTAQPAVRDIGAEDLRASLRQGLDDFLAMPSHVFFLGLIYPLAGVFLAGLTFGNNVLPMLFPLAAGFALIGPFAAVGLYELSRRRAAGLDTDGRRAFTSLRRHSAWALGMLGLVLAVIFVAWLIAAQGLYWALYGTAQPDTVLGFVADVLTTPRGWALIVLGNLVGFAFSVLVLAVSLVSVPMVVDRHVDALTAVETSLAAFRRNPRTLVAWGFVVAGLLVMGSLPLFIGLAVVMPVLGHATWHLYRRLVPA